MNPRQKCLILRKIFDRRPISPISFPAASDEAAIQDQLNAFVMNAQAETIGSNRRQALALSLVLLSLALDGPGSVALCVGAHSR